ncbi:MAG TPA: hypothetical protein EYP18_13195 [Desulfobacterales bacterium]|nr:hypothetical protein [Desulfobacterales bacterium]
MALFFFYSSRIYGKINIRDFKNLFPLARELKRKIVFHVGPTNSGKTYQALKALEEATTGYYLAPLRLLALEGYENLKKEGVNIKKLEALIVKLSKLLSNFPQIAELDINPLIASENDIFAVDCRIKIEE